MFIDQFVYMNATSTVEMRVLDNQNNPINLNLVDVYVKTALEWVTPMIEQLDSNNGITIINANTAIIQVKFNPTPEKGYRPGKSVYQLIARYKSDNLVRICSAGHLFIEPTITEAE